MGAIGDAIRPPNAAPYRVPVGDGPRGSGTRPVSMGVLVVDDPGALAVTVCFLSRLGVRGGPVIAASSGTVRGNPLDPLPACDGVTVIVGGPQSSSSSFAPPASSLSFPSASAGSLGGEGVFGGPLNDVRFGLQECVGLKIGVGETVREPLYRLPGGVLRAGNGGAVPRGEVGGERNTSSRSGRLAWRRSRVPKFLT